MILPEIFDIGTCEVMLDVESERVALGLRFDG
jgi:hypothetical protein